MADRPNARWVLLGVVTFLLLLATMTQLNSQPYWSSPQPAAVYRTHNVYQIAQEILRQHRLQRDNTTTLARLDGTEPPPRNQIKMTSSPKIKPQPAPQAGKPIEVMLPSTSGNSAPFKQGPCFRQVHFWCNNAHSYSGRSGDFSCPGLECGLRYVINTDFNSLQTSDAVILFHRTGWDWATMHQKKPNGQKWIFYTQESPRHTSGHVIPPPKYYYNSYDYIMSYRSREAHLYGSYGRYYPNKPEGSWTNSTNWAENKTKEVAWMASNCGTSSWDRFGFVKTFSKYIPVSMYGSCGTLPCPRGPKCNKLLGQHKFYLSFENSECRDYITEKLWRNAYMNSVVPVVYGPPREDYERVAPPNSFIHVQDFNSVPALVDYLKKVGQDPVLYNSYFKWKRDGSTQFTEEEWIFEPEQMCDIVVSRLLTDEKAMKDGTYQPRKFPDWKEWWSNSCHHTSNYPISLN